MAMENIKELLDGVSFSSEDFEDIEILASCTSACTTCNQTCTSCVSACQRCVSGGY